MATIPAGVKFKRRRGALGNPSRPAMPETASNAARSGRQRERGPDNLAQAGWLRAGGRRGIGGKLVTVAPLQYECREHEPPVWDCRAPKRGRGRGHRVGSSPAAHGPPRRPRHPLTDPAHAHGRQACRAGVLGRLPAHRCRHRRHPPHASGGARGGHPLQRATCTHEARSRRRRPATLAAAAAAAMLATNPLPCLTPRPRRRRSCTRAWYGTRRCTGPRSSRCWRVSCGPRRAAGVSARLPPGADACAWLLPPPSFLLRLYLAAHPSHTQHCTSTARHHSLILCTTCAMRTILTHPLAPPTAHCKPATG